MDPEGRRCERIATPNGSVEAWITRSDCIATTTLDGRKPPPGLLAIKFPGTAGRAERGGPHPFELFGNVISEVWTINPIGYGGSDGVASLRTTATTCDAVWDAVKQRYPGKPIAVVGNSLGCLSALYLASRQPVAGVYLRNPVALQQMIATRPRYNWWNFGLARQIARQVPGELDAVTNSAPSQAPLLMVTSEKDRVSPPRYQNLIFDAYQGPKFRFVIKNASHGSPIPDEQVAPYKAQVGEFLRMIEVP